MTSWKALVELLPELRAFSRSITSDREAADDAVSDALERAALSSRAPSHGSALRNWMFRTIRNLHVDRYRRARVRRDHAASLVDHENHAFQSDPERHAVLRDALSRLQDHERKIIELVDIIGLTYAEAAEQLNIPVGTVMSRVSRARAALMRLLSPPVEAKRKGGS